LNKIIRRIIFINSTLSVSEGNAGIDSNAENADAGIVANLVGDAGIVANLVDDTDAVGDTGSDDSGSDDLEIDDEIELSDDDIETGEEDEDY
jgi:hypothetical protein